MTTWTDTPKISDTTTEQALLIEEGYKLKIDDDFYLIIQEEQQSGWTEIVKT